MRRISGKGSNMESDEIRVKNEVDLNTAVSYIEGIVSSLKQGRICVQHGDESVVLEPKDVVRVEVKAGKKHQKESVSLKISWRLPPEPRKDEAGLRISADLPSQTPDEFEPQEIPTTP
jgi:amphi-Trp domain-containing protein